MFKPTSKQNISMIGSVKMAQHNEEFNEFYNSYRRICDRLSGLKYFIKVEIDIPEKKIITPERFGEAIYTLDGFRLRYAHNIDENTNAHLNKEIRELQDEFINDYDYHKFVKNIDNLTTTNRINFLVLYLKYLNKCFKLFYKIADILQESMGVTLSEKEKKVRYYNQTSFFSNTFEYATEVSELISHLEYIDLIEGYKKILGYYYTFKYIIHKEIVKKIDILLELFYQYITHPETINKIIKLLDKGDYSDSFYSELRKEYLDIRTTFFNYIYYKINCSLSERNIMPKIKSNLLLDRSLI